MTVAFLDQIECGRFPRIGNLAQSAGQQHCRQPISGQRFQSHPPNLGNARMTDNLENRLWLAGHAEFKNCSRRDKEADFGASNASASLPQRLRLLR